MRIAWKKGTRKIGGTEEGHEKEKQKARYECLTTRSSGSRLCFHGK